MKKIIYDSRIARHLLMKSFSTITIAAWVLTKYKTVAEMPQYVRNHESIHVRQWAECMVTSGVIVWALVLFAGISPLWFILAFIVFYILYVFEWLIKLCFYGRAAYHHISFEREANAGEDDETYLENSGYFGWVKYVLKG